MGVFRGDSLAGERNPFISNLFDRDSLEVRVSLIGIFAYVLVGMRRS